MTRLALRGSHATYRHGLRRCAAWATAVFYRITATAGCEPGVNTTQRSGKMASQPAWAAAGAQLRKGRSR